MTKRDPTAKAKAKAKIDIPENYRFFRYLAPNAVTAASMVFGMISVIASHHGNFDLAGWMIIYAVFTDRLDGMVARTVRGTSEFGVNMDSFADFMNFGLAPAFLIFTFFDAHPQLGMDTGWHHYFVIFACVCWVLGAVFRLARFNVAAEEGVPTKIFFGVPTTLAGGTLIIWFLAFLKYSAPEMSEPFGGTKLLGDDLHTPHGVWAWFPVGMLVGAFLMASSLRVLKVGTTARKATTIFVLGNVVVGYVLGFAQMYPEYLVWAPTAWLVVFLIWGQVAESARAYNAPPIFPRRDDDKLHMRPQEDMALDEDDE